jgi:hypothetical protein
MGQKTGESADGKLHDFIMETIENKNANQNLHIKK